MFVLDMGYPVPGINSDRGAQVKNRASERVGGGEGDKETPLSPDWSVVSEYQSRILLILES